jgi:hypothetical protein
MSPGYAARYRLTETSDCWERAVVRCSPGGDSLLQLESKRAAVKRPLAGYNLLGDGMQPGVGSLLDFRAAPHSGKRGVSVPEPFSRVVRKRVWIGGELFTLEQIAGHLHIRIGTAEPCGLGPVSTRWCHAA